MHKQKESGQSLTEYAIILSLVAVALSRQPHFWREQLKEK